MAGVRHIRGICYHVCGMVHVKDILVLLERVAHVVTEAGFLSGYLRVLLPYIRRQITVTKCVECIIKYILNICKVVHLINITTRLFLLLFVCLVKTPGCSTSKW